MLGLNEDLLGMESTTKRTGHIGCNNANHWKGYFELGNDGGFTIDEVVKLTVKHEVRLLKIWMFRTGAIETLLCKR